MNLLRAGKIALASLREHRTPRSDAAQRRLRPGFLLGAATSSHQVEGGNDNDWTER